MRILVVDGANVVGAVPDGWWADRAGAAARLHEGLVAAELTFDSIVLVLEGRGRAGVAEGRRERVTTVHAPGSGDDEIVAQARRLASGGHDVTVATADRGLIDRLADVEITVLGPRALRDRLRTR
ncbi:MAG: hypothetical protein QM779_06485 [Propionicimonas sp.]|uniref:hypothetical protein n=1 Tax=Propionicimonas sp. TaxID=1955623 RepID=UPI003D1067DD